MAIEGNYKQKNIFTAETCWLHVRSVGDSKIGHRFECLSLSTIVTGPAQGVPRLPPSDSWDRPNPMTLWYSTKQVQTMNAWIGGLHNFPLQKTYGRSLNLSIFTSETKNKAESRKMKAYLSRHRIHLSAAHNRSWYWLGPIVEKKAAG